VGYISRDMDGHARLHMVEFSPDIKFEFTFYQVTPLLMWMLMHWQLRAIVYVEITE
jgi:hypothetical protein